MSVPPVVPATLNLDTIPSDELVERKTKAAVLEEAPDSDGEGILKSKDIQRLQWVGQSLVVFCYVWWDRLAIFGHNRAQCKEELDLLHAQLSEWNALSKEQQSRIEDFKKKKVQTESRVHFLHIVEALYKEVPEIYHDLIKGDYEELTSAKSADLIYEDIIPIEVFANGNDRSTDPCCLSLLGYDSTRKRYAQCPNLLFPEGKAFKNGPALFRSSALVKILSHVLLGASSLTTGKKTRSMNTVLWGKSAVTPGAIVFATVVISAQFLLTSDKFTETGESTSIPYAADYRFYIKTIETTLNLTSTTKTLEYFDRNLFLPKRNIRGLVVASAEEASDEEEEIILRGLHEPEEDREMEVAFSDEESAADATLLSPQLTLRAPTATLGTSIASNYVDVSSDDNDIDDDNNIHNSNNDDNDNDEIMVNSTPPNMPIESNAVVAKTAWLQVPAMRTKTVTFALPGTDTAKLVENTAQGALNDGSMATRGGTRGRGGKGGKHQGQKKATGNVQNAPRGRNLCSRGATNTLVTLHQGLPTSLVDSGHCGMGNYNNGSVKMSRDHCLSPNLHSTARPTASATPPSFLPFGLARADHITQDVSSIFSSYAKGKGERAQSLPPLSRHFLCLRIYSTQKGLLSEALPPRLNLSLATPSPSGATTSQECWEQAQPQPNGILEDFDAMEDVQPSLPEIASSSGSEPCVEYIRTEYHPHSNRPPRLDKFESTTLTVPLKGEDYEFTVYHRDLWAWMLDILQDPLLAPYLNWDAQRLFKTALPTGGKPICYIIYADKTWLSSFGMVQGYPIIVRLGNLPSHIHNGQGVGGGRVIGWLPIIKEEAKHKDKSYYADFKRAIWHKAFESILLPIKGKSKFGAWVQVAGGMETMPCHLYLFPTIMILSADYEEQCMMALTWGSKAKFLCNVCLVPLKELSAEAQRIYEEAAKIRGATKRNTYLKTFGLRFIKKYQNTFWEIAHCDIHHALSFDRLHTFNNRLFADHLLEEIKGRILKLGPSFGQEADELLEAFPSWKDLYHFKQGFMNLIFIVHAIFMAAKDHVGSILLRALRIYMELDVYASLTLHTSDSLRDGWVRIPILASLIKEYEKAVCNEDEAMRQATINTCRTPKETKTKNWNFPKAHSHQHLFDDIEAKGITLNYNMKPNESMHGSFKESYQRRTNFKNVDEQILRVDDWYNAMAYLRHQINHHDKIKKEFGDDQVAEGETRAEDKDKDEQVLVSGSANSDEDYTAAASLHGRCGKGGGKLTMAEVEAQAIDNSDFREFRTRLSTHMKKHFESHPEELPSDNGIPAEFAGFECQDQVCMWFF
ncbi:hypothetical protein IW261DRAFT_1428573 [Armillaria novae-zelandiae]|uniref:Uncharacterized protein n=1 Tax=Armillaria novae-zelandiae TaxID=153914 RepID=A0AA39N9F5_9AGAR|nr:hypothetical protein IW261DRAFT_1428573 [Armillaria novae-zelandiae]